MFLSLLAAIAMQQMCHVVQQAMGNSQLTKKKEYSASRLAYCPLLIAYCLLPVVHRQTPVSHSFTILNETTPFCICLKTTYTYFYTNLPLRKTLKILGRVFLSILLLLIVIWAFLQTDWGQNWLARQVTGRLSKDLQTKISIDHVSIGFFNRMELEGVYVEDQKKDTLLYAGAVKVRITDWFFFKDKAVLEYIGLENAVINFNRTDSVWNYGFLANYFASTDTATVKKEAGIQFNLKTVDLDRVRFVQKDAWKGSDMIVSIGSLDLDARNISVSEKEVLINSVAITDPYFSTLNYKGKYSDTTSSANDWRIVVNNITLNNGRFRMDNDDYVPDVTHFDGGHMDFRAITGTATNFSMQGDTIKATVKLAATERSGFTINNLQSALTIQPGTYRFDDLLLQTDRTTL
ncbi:MAG TPA: hypothetical protein VGE32_07655, partial [Cellvibrio sp.]